VKKLYWAAAGCCAVALVMAGQVSAAAGSPKPPLPPPPTAELPGARVVPGGVSSWAELMSVQQRLDTAAQRIADIGDKDYTGIVVSAEKDTLTVYWKGGRPSGAAAAAVDAARDAGSVRVLPARYSEKEMLAAADRVVRVGGVAAVTPKVDGSGLTVSVGPGIRPAVPLTSEVPITRVDTAQQPQLASRGDDSPPYWGGARWYSPLGGCSSGFAISIAGASKMLSAGHCANNGDTAVDGGGQVMGTVSGVDKGHDRLFINTWSAGRIYDGGVGTGEFSKPVVGAAHSFVGDWLCTSGAYSGARCNEQVKAVNQTIYVGYYITQLVMAEQVDHTNAVGNGDSGGPVFSLYWADYNKVIAKGTNTAIDTSTQVPCTGVPTGGGRICAWRFYYVDVVNSLNAYGASIITG